MRWWAIAVRHSLVAFVRCFVGTQREFNRALLRLREHLDGPRG